MGKIDNQKSCSRTFGWSCTTSWTLGARRHGTAFNFAVFHAGNQIDVLESYFNVRGEQRHGLLIDPGAASGLIGSDTLKQLMDHCITPFGKQHEVSINYSKTTPVSGISGEATRLWEKSPSLYKAGGYSIMYTADVIGGSGSTCPALFGNPTLCRLDASIFANWFANGDGLMMVGGREKDSEEKHYRIFPLALDRLRALHPADRPRADSTRGQGDQEGSHAVHAEGR